MFIRTCLQCASIGLILANTVAIADESAISKVLPSDLDGQVWGYLDELEGFRADAVARARKAPKAVEP